MRPASEIADQICGCATREQHNRDVALIEADRAALVAEIVAYFRSPWHPNPDAHCVAHEIEKKWGKPE